MYSLKGFVAYGAMADNAPGAVATLGELSTDSLTYAKEKGQYTLADYPDAILVSFSSYQDDSMVKVPTAFSTQALKIGQWIFEESTTGALSADSNSFLRELLAEFGTEITDVTVGDMVSNDAGYWMPEWISYVSTEEESRVKLWFADHAFSNQYDSYEIEFIKPIDNLDDFFKIRSTVTSLVNAKDFNDRTAEIQAARGDYPYTILRSDLFVWNDPNSDTNTLDVFWPSLIYGTVGNNIDIVKQDLADWILGQSTHTREEWAEIFPDIFTNTEFIITPLWTQYAIANKTLQAGVYSPTIDFKKALEIAKQTAQGTGYSDNHIESHLRASFVPYKSLAFLALGSPENRDGILDFNQRFVDYISVTTDSGDFNRMSVKTQNWVLFFYELLKIAEEMTEFSDIPLGYSRISRNGVLYVSANYDNIQYLVVLRSYLETIDAPHVG